MLRIIKTNYGKISTSIFTIKINKLIQKNNSKKNLNQRKIQIIMICWIQINLKTYLFNQMEKKKPKNQMFLNQNHFLYSPKTI